MFLQPISHPSGGFPNGNVRFRFVFGGKIPVLLLALALSGCRPAPPPPSILLVVVDTLRADAVDVLGPEDRPHRGATPRLDRFADDAAVFRRTVTPAPFTMPAMAAMMTGAWPDRSGVIAHEPGSSLRAWPGATLAEAARRSGLATAAVVANPWLVRRGTGFDRGFDEFSRVFRPGQAEGANSATAVTDEAIRLLDGLAGRRFLMWVHYFDPHMPYGPPPRFAAAAGAAPAPSRVMADFSADDRDLGRLYRGEGYDAGEIEQARRLYDGEVRYVDAEIGRLLDRVAALGLAPGTIVVVASDHGEALGEHGLFFAHDYTLYDELVRAVLMLKGPGVPAALREDEASLVDAMPTLCRLAALDCDDARDGRDLFGRPGSPRTLFAAATPMRSRGTAYDGLAVEGPEGRWTMALRDGRKLVRRPTPRGATFEMYDHATDPAELRDLSRDENFSASRRELEASLDAWRREMEAVRPATPARDDARDERTLRSLGYLQ